MLKSKIFDMPPYAVDHNTFWGFIVEKPSSKEIKNFKYGQSHTRYTANDLFGFKILLPFSSVGNDAAKSKILL